MATKARMMQACDIPHVEYVAQLSRHLASVPISQVEHRRRGSVAIVIRLALPSDSNAVFPTFAAPKQEHSAQLVQALDAFLKSPELKVAQAQVLFIRRSVYPGDPWSGHIGFPGGKREPQDGSDRVTAERETMEELDMDLRDSAFVYMGRMDDVQAYSLFEGILMIVCPHVYLQISQHTPPMALSDEVASAHWVDLEQILCRVDHPTASFSQEYRAISFDMASRLFPKHASRQSLWFRIHSWVLGKIHYTMLPLRFTGDNSIVRQPSDAGSRSRFASDTELYLWGISLGMASSLVDLSLPVAPRVLGPGYVSVTSPWPQLDRYRWADVNLVTNFIHRFAWSPGRRKPWFVRVKHTPSGRVVGPATDYFLSYFGVLQVVFPLSCLAKLALLCVLGRGAARLAARLVR